MTPGRQRNYSRGDRLTQNEMRWNGALCQINLAKSLPFVQGDAIELNKCCSTCMNAVEAMAKVNERKLLITTKTSVANKPVVEVQDTSPALNPNGLQHVFDAFYTTKPSGMGM
jgi:C4-dicarboxylate-specific signal transduction histidine kinase